MNNMQAPEQISLSCASCAFSNVQNFIIILHPSALREHWPDFIKQAGTFPEVNNAKENHMQDVRLGSLHLL